jgi:hypothetical protein
MKDICLVGYGRWGKILLPKLNDICKGKVHVIRGRDIQSIKRLPDCSWFFVATPDHTHYEIVKHCLLNGKNVFCEKPLTLSLEKSKELFEISSKMGTRLYVSDVENYGKNDIKINKKNYFYRTKQQKILNPIDVLEMLFYHDAYMIKDYIERGEVKNISIKKLDKSNVKFKIIFENTQVDFEYVFEQKETQHKLNNTDIDRTTDKLSIMIRDVLKNNVDYQKNKNSALFANKIIDLVKEEIKKKELV